MSDVNYNKLLNEIRDVKTGLRDVHMLVENMEKDIKSEMKLKHQEIEFKHESHERRLTFTERMVFGAAGLMLTFVIAAMLTVTLK